jgi:hypothetical protein
MRRRRNEHLRKGTCKRDKCYDKKERKKERKKEKKTKLGNIFFWVDITVWSFVNLATFRRKVLRYSLS